MTKHRKLMATALLCCPLLLSQQALSFVLVGGKTAARLDTAAGQSDIYFNLPPESPNISEKEAFFEGAYSHLSDEDFFVALFTEALKPWNSVYGADISLNVNLETDSLEANAEDFQHNVTLEDVNASMSAFAYPHIVDGTIVDCDITIARRKKAAQELAYTIMHEIGHCLGLGHNHSNLDAVMGYGRPDRSLRLSFDDQAGLIYLYPDPDVDGSQMQETLGCASLGSPKNNPLLGFWGLWLALTILPGLILARDAFGSA